MLTASPQPGPLLIAERPDVFWGPIASMLIGNVMLVILNLPLVGIFVTLLRTPRSYLAPLVLLICILGIYSVRGSAFDLIVMFAVGVIGYVLRRFDFDLVPFLFAFVLGDRIEVNFRRALMISEGDPAVFWTGPAAKLFLAVLAAIVVYMVASSLIRRRLPG